MSKIKLILCYAVCLLSTQYAIAKTVFTPTIMANILYIKSNSNQFEYVNEYETITDPNYYIQSLNLGGLVRFGKLHSTLTSNRFFNNVNTREVRSKATGTIFNNRDEITNDTLGVGYLHNKVNIALLFANVNKEDELIYNNSIVSKTNAHDIVKGISAGYYINPRTLISTSYFEGSKDLKLQYAISFNIFYSFKDIL